MLFLSICLSLASSRLDQIYHSQKANLSILLKQSVNILYCTKSIHNVCKWLVVLFQNMTSASSVCVGDMSNLSSSSQPTVVSLVYPNTTVSFLEAIYGHNTQFSEHATYTKPIEPIQIQQNHVMSCHILFNVFNLIHNQWINIVLLRAFAKCQKSLYHCRVTDIITPFYPDKYQPMLFWLSINDIESRLSLWCTIISFTKTRFSIRLCSVC